MKQNETNFTHFTPKNLAKYHCEICNFSTSKKNDYTRHLSTDKHKNGVNETNVTEMKQNYAKKLHCLCGCVFNSRSTLWRHKKKCNQQIQDDSEIESVYTEETNIDEPELTDKQIIAMLIKENSEFKTLMMEVLKNGTHNTTTTNSHNKTFNLNFFLNEQCKDALNMSDFINSIVIELADLEHTGRAGFVEGISKLLLKNLKALEQSKRPIHCSDLKRETLYIKDNNKWEKDDEEKLKLKNAIKEIAHENIKKISDWTQQYPECKDPESRKNDLFLKIVSNCMSGGSEEEMHKNLNNIVRNIAREVVIEK
jgi:hypothetical protein